MGWAKENIPELKKVGLISSTGTQISKLFHNIFGLAGIEVIVPEAEDQQQVMDAIFGDQGIKAGFTSGPSKERIIRAAKLDVDNTMPEMVCELVQYPWKV